MASKTIEVDFVLGDKVYAFNDTNRLLEVHQVVFITVGELILYKTNKDISFMSSDIGITIFSNTEEARLPEKQLVRKQIPAKIGKPLFDSYAKQWCFVTEINDDYVQIVTILGDKLSMSMAGYGRYWAFSETES